MWTPCYQHAVHQSQSSQSINTLAAVCRVAMAWLPIGPVPATEQSHNISTGPAAFLDDLFYGCPPKDVCSLRCCTLAVYQAVVPVQSFPGPLRFAVSSSMKMSSTVPKLCTTVRRKHRSARSRNTPHRLAPLI